MFQSHLCSTFITIVLCSQRDPSTFSKKGNTTSFPFHFSIQIKSQIPLIPSRRRRWCSQFAQNLRCAAMMTFSTITPAAPEEAVWLGSYSMPRTMQLAPLLDLTCEEETLEGTYTNNRQKSLLVPLEMG